MLKKGASTTYRGRVPEWPSEQTPETQPEELHFWINQKKMAESYPSRNVKIAMRLGRLASLLKDSWPPAGWCVMSARVLKVGRN
jgi:hypothetical protein